VISYECFSEKAGFNDVLAQKCHDYLCEKEDSGIQIKKPMQILLRFLRMCQVSGEPLDHASKEAVERWNAMDPNETPRNHYYRATEVRRFLRYLVANGVDAYIDEDIRWMRSSFIPYILSHDEIRRIFSAADNLPYTPISPQRVPVMSLLFRILYGCGLRVSEALALVMDDVDLDNGILRIRNSKFGKERLVPMSESLTKRCAEYSAVNCAGKSSTAPFFQTPQGGHYCVRTIYYAWRQILYYAGISHGGKGHGPRIHDIRHTFAVHCLQRWVDESVDLETVLPYLSTYMGHVGISSTQEYLHLTSELFPQITRAFESSFDVFPKVEVSE
jgi:integrase